MDPYRVVFQTSARQLKGTAHRLPEFPARSLFQVTDSFIQEALKLPCFNQDGTIIASSQWLHMAGVDAVPRHAIQMQILVAACIVHGVWSHFALPHLSSPKHNILSELHNTGLFNGDVPHVAQIVRIPARLDTVLDGERLNMLVSDLEKMEVSNQQR